MIEIVHVLFLSSTRPGVGPWAPAGKIDTAVNLFTALAAVGAYGDDAEFAPRRGWRPKMNMTHEMSTTLMIAAGFMTVWAMTVMGMLAF